MHKPGETLTKTWRITADLHVHEGYAEERTAVEFDGNPCYGRWAEYAEETELRGPYGTCWIRPLLSSSFEEYKEGDDWYVHATRYVQWQVIWAGDWEDIEGAVDELWTYDAEWPDYPFPPMPFEGGSGHVHRSFTYEEEAKFYMAAGASTPLVGGEGQGHYCHPPDPNGGEEWDGCAPDWCGFPDSSASYGDVLGVAALGIPLGEVTMRLTGCDNKTAINSLSVNDEACYADCHPYGGDLRGLPFAPLEIATLGITADHCVYPDILSSTITEKVHESGWAIWGEGDTSYWTYDGSSVTFGSRGFNHAILVTEAASMRLNYVFDFTDLETGTHVAVGNREQANVYVGAPDYEWTNGTPGDLGDFDVEITSEPAVIPVVYRGKAGLISLPPIDYGYFYLASVPQYFCEADPSWGNCVMVDDKAPSIHRLVIKRETLAALGQPYFPNELPHGIGEIEGCILTAILDDAPGSGYEIGDILNVVQSGAEGGTVRVTSVRVDHGVDGIELVDVGHGYTGGYKTTSAVAPGVGAGFVVVITAGKCDVPIGFGDRRLPMQIADWDWDALTIKHNSGVTLWEFDDDAPWSGTGCTFNDSTGKLSVEVDGEDREATADFAPATPDDDAIGPWCSHYRFVKLQWIPTVTDGGAIDTSGSMRFWLGEKYWDLTYKAGDRVGDYLETEIDLCRPHGTVASSSAQQSYLDWYFPRSVGQIAGLGYVAGNENNSELYESCDGLVPVAERGRTFENEWYWGVSRVDEVKLDELTDARTYIIGWIKGIVKQYSYYIPTNQWGWRFDREADRVAKVRSGIFALTGSGPPEARFAESDEILGWIITDGMVAAEISGLYWHQQGHAEEATCCDTEHHNPLLCGLGNDGKWTLMLDMWPKRPAVMGIESIVVNPAEEGVPVTQAAADSDTDYDIVRVDSTVGFADYGALLVPSGLVFYTHLGRWDDDEWKDTGTCFTLSYPLGAKVGEDEYIFGQPPGGLGASYLSNLRDVRHLAYDTEWRLINLSNPVELKGNITTDEFTTPEGGGCLAEGEAFTLNVTKRFGHQVHGLMFNGNTPARLKKLQIEHSDGEVLEVTTDNVGAFDAHIPYQNVSPTGEATDVVAVRAGYEVSLNVPVRQRRMTCCGILVPAVVARAALDECTTADDVLCIAQGGDDETALLRSYDRGVAWEPDTAAYEASEAQAVWSAENRELGLVSVVNGEAVQRLALSPYTFPIEWSVSVERIFAATVTDVATVYHPTVGIWFYVAIRGTDVVLKRSVDAGATFLDAAEVVIVDGVAAEAGLAMTIDQTNAIHLVYINTSGECVTLKSEDLGENWA